MLLLLRLESVLCALDQFCSPGIGEPWTLGSMPMQCFCHPDLKRMLHAPNHHGSVYDTINEHALLAGNKNAPWLSQAGRHQVYCHCLLVTSSHLSVHLALAHQSSDGTNDNAYRPCSPCCCGNSRGGKGLPCSTNQQALAAITISAMVQPLESLHMSRT